MSGLILTQCPLAGFPNGFEDTIPQVKQMIYEQNITLWIHLVPPQNLTSLTMTETSCAHHVEATTSLNSRLSPSSSSSRVNDGHRGPVRSCPNLLREFLDPQVCGRGHCIGVSSFNTHPPHSQCRGDHDDDDAPSSSALHCSETSYALAMTDYMDELSASSVSVNSSSASSSSIMTSYITFEHWPDFDVPSDDHDEVSTFDDDVAHHDDVI